MIDNDVKKYIRESVLCWLATSNRKNEPNVSPKEMFTFQDDTTLLIANIASPISVRNIKDNPKVCVSFVHIFIQKGYKLKGVASIIDREDAAFEIKSAPLTALFSDKYPIKSIIEIKVTRLDKILAPSYYLFPDTSEKSQITSAMKTYKVRPSDKCDND